MNPFHFGNFRNQPVPHGAELGCAAGNVGTGSLDGNAQPDDGCDIFGARPVATFLGAAVNQVGQANALAAVQRANALLGMDFVAGRTRVPNPAAGMTAFVTFIKYLLILIAENM